METEKITINEQITTEELTLEEKLQLVQEAIARQNKKEAAEDPYFVPTDPMDALQCESCQ